MKRKFFISTALLLISSLACNMGAGSPPSDPMTGATPGLPTTSSPVPPAIPADGCANSYFPVKVGATWNYNLTGTVSDTYTTTIVAADSSGFTEQNTFASGVTRTGVWTCENGNLLSLNPSGGNSATVNTSDITSEFHTTAKSGVTVPASIDPGNAWNQTLTIEGTQTVNGTQMASKNEMSAECNAIGIEAVSVAAGSFQAMRVECAVTMSITVNMNGTDVPAAFNMNSTTWYAPNVGMIKTSSTGSDINTVIELQSYSIP